MPAPAPTSGEIGRLLAELVARAESPRAVAISADQLGRLREAVERAGAQLLGEVEISFTIALAGCSGAGKSTLINALAAGVIAEVSEVRPTTRQIKVYHHQAVAGGGLPAELAQASTFVPHDRPELRHKVIVDTPDLDTFAVQHRAATRALLKAAGLVIYVFSPERYAEERAWSVIREEQRFSHCLAVVNKADTVAPGELARICEEIRTRFAELGKPDLKVLAICAARHLPHAQNAAAHEPALDEFLTLRAYIEHELALSDVVQMLRHQRARVVDHLAEEVEALLPANADEALEKLAAAGVEEAKQLHAKLRTDLGARLLAVESELEPLAVVRSHQRFRGPFGAWLATWDFIRYQLPRTVRQFRILPSDADPAPVEQILVTGQESHVQDLLRDSARRLQDTCYTEGLPVARWSQIAAQPTGADLLRRTARALQSSYEAAAADLYGSLRWFTSGVSFLGFVTPLALGGLALYELWNELLSGQLTRGFDLLALVLVMTGLVYVLLHGLVDGVQATFENLHGEGTGERILDETIHAVIADWTATYRAEIESDLQDLRRPVAQLRTLLDRRALHFATAGTWSAPDDGAPRLAASPETAAGQPPADAAETLPPAVEPPPATPGHRLREALGRGRSPS